MESVQDDRELETVGFNKTTYFFLDDLGVPPVLISIGTGAIDQDPPNFFFLDGSGKGSAEFEQRGEAGRTEKAVEIEENPADRPVPGRGRRPGRVFWAGR
jgi:hypothetical protein